MAKNGEIADRVDMRGMRSHYWCAEVTQSCVGEICQLPYAPVTTEQPTDTPAGLDDRPITIEFNGPITIEMNDDTVSEQSIEAALTDGGAGADAIPVDEPNALVDELSDRLHALRALSHDSEGGEGADAILQEFGAKGKVEQDIVKELSALKPLWMPHRFEQAHYLVMRSLEVLDRNGARAAKLPKLGPLQPIASWLVQLVARFIVRNHQAEVITSIKNLYIRREANSPKNSPERFMLRRARIDAERCLPTLKKNPLGVPTFLLGGAFVSWISSALGSAIEHAKSKTGLLIAVLVLFMLFAGASWAVLRGAAVARNRIKMSLDKPLNALWETIGAAGKPPKDSAKSFALIAIIITGLGFVLIPVAIAVAVFR
jgi:hypothetical protein